MSADPTSTTFVITIKTGRRKPSAAESQDLTERVRAIYGEGASVTTQEMVGGGEIYISTRPNKRERLDAIQAMPEHMTAAQIGASLGMTDRQVRRYRELLRTLSQEAA